ncbi:MAG: hypothetical protein ACSHX0_08680 [Akkermansiaceae bacterium]
MEMTEGMESRAERNSLFYIHTIPRIYPLYPSGVTSTSLGLRNPKKPIPQNLHARGMPSALGKLWGKSGDRFGYDAWLGPPTYHLDATPSGVGELSWRGSRGV